MFPNKTRITTLPRGFKISRSENSELAPAAVWHLQGHSYLLYLKKLVWLTSAYQGVNVKASLASSRASE